MAENRRPRGHAGHESEPRPGFRSGSVRGSTRGVGAKSSTQGEVLGLLSVQRGVRRQRPL